jgi:ABC-type glycerol-3-phosphate transport system permease component
VERRGFLAAAGLTGLAGLTAGCGGGPPADAATWSMWSSSPAEAKVWHDFSAYVERTLAARLDGANRWQTFMRVVIPMAVPAVATLLVFKFSSQWNDLLWPLVISNSDATRTVPVGPQAFQDTNGTQWNLLLAAAAITTIPLIVLFFLTQRWFVRGITMSGLGGR